MSIFLTLFIISSVLLGLGFFVIFLLKKSKANKLIPSGKIVYDDLVHSSELLRSSIYPIAGKPDLILKKGFKRIPVEVKTGNHHEPKIHHVMQLMAYCQLTKEHYMKSTPCGYLIYPDTAKRYKINFGRNEKKRLESTIIQMDHILKTKNINRNHENKRKCKGCKLKSYCQMKIT